MAIDLSIMICSVTGRTENKFPLLISNLEKQIKSANAEDRVEIISITDNKKRTVGEKRNNLVSLSQGKYAGFADDDDLLDKDYISEILKAIDSSNDPDVIVFQNKFYFNGNYVKPTKFGIEYTYSQDKDFFYRKPWHINIWKKSLMEKYKFPAINKWEDEQWSNAISGEIKKQHTIDKVLYHYYFDSEKTETQKKKTDIIENCSGHKEKLIGCEELTHVYDVDICIISYAKDDKLKKVTDIGIETLLASEKEIKFNVYVVESNKNINYDNFGENVKTIYPDSDFGYHKYLNMAIRAGNSEFVVLCNNDLSFESGFASAIIKQMEKDKEIMSSSPFCPQTQNISEWKNETYYGHRVRQEFAGWCIFLRRKVFDIIGMLDERFVFWWCDNDLAKTLEVNNLKHVLVPASKVNHHAHFIGKVSTNTLDDEEKQKMTWAQEQIFKDKWNLT